MAGLVGCRVSASGQRLMANGSALRSRRAQLDVQFNWIFILVAGAVILAFFFSIVQKQRVLSEQKLAFTLANELEAAATGAQVARGTAQFIPVPRSGVTFECSADCSCSYGVGSELRPYEDKLIFAPDSVRDEDMLFWALDWKVPFRVSNFLMVTNKRVQYFIVVDERSASSVNLRDRVRQVLPKGVNAREISVSDVSRVANENFVEARFVFLDVRPPAGRVELHPSFLSTDVSLVSFEGDASGTVTFYQRKNRRVNEFVAKPSAYVDVTSFFAAFFADGVTMYDCNMGRGYRRLQSISEVYAQRVWRLVLDESVRARGCVYDVAPLVQLNQSAGVLRNQVVVEEVARLLAAEDALRKQNDRLVRASCPTIY